MFTEVKLVQLQNVKSPIDVTELGMFTDVKLVQPSDEFKRKA